MVCLKLSCLIRDIFNMRVRFQFFLFSFLFCICLSLHSFSSLHASETEQDLPKSIPLYKSLVFVKIYSVSTNYLHPWKTDRKKPQFKMALVLPNKRLLVILPNPEEPVLIEVMKYSNYEKVIAKIVYIESSTKLAILKTCCGNGW